MENFFFFAHIYSPFTRKANCIAVFWTGCPHSLRSSHFRGVLATCLPYKDGGVLFSTLLKDTTSELAVLFSTTSPKCRAGKLWILFFKVSWYDSRGIDLRFTDCEANALTITPPLRSKFEETSGAILSRQPF